MNHDLYSDEYIGSILKSVKTIALVGASPKAERPSNRVMQFLLSKGFRVIPVNPGLPGREICSQPVVASLGDIEEPVDMVDVFRAPAYLGRVVDDALAMDPRPSVIWGQLEVRDDQAAARAEEYGMKVVMDRCPAIEMPRLGL